ncbi:hypothetical protein [Bhargavaea beijingensis]|uniref:Yip1 domain-containing protein n=1 Tax=Bhargavaea beijingensis TaxID=426756 RepID=A0A1G7H7S4_9BACL|nr:hypothetical protein [Bhargavaea beijingensis]MCW1928862.1 hypothetical protein [Bhargavaea beijingensis]RSK29944.1 hypothetical protein EJA12_10255 [Bhargavaea beijingensis]SDE96490.1 hypothetical protein SAMN04488126_1369 [Bhargavaea beijingensis]
MFFEFKFWHFLLNQRELTDRMAGSAMKGFRWRIAGLFISAAVLYALMNMWGIGTRDLTPIAVSGAEGTFALRRILSLASAILWSVIYTAFHVYAVAFILHKLTSAGYRKLVVLQLFVTAILLLEKAIVFAVFLVSGAAAPVSPLSFGPLALTFMTYPPLIYLFNQLSIGTALVVAYQFRFIRLLLPEAGRGLLWILLGLQVLMALAVSLYGMVPAEQLFTELFGGGAAVE